MSRHTTGSLLIAGCALSWGVIAVIVREMSLPATTIAAYRVLMSAAAVALILVLIGRRDLLRPPPKVVLMLGVLLAVHWSLFFASLKATSVASAVLVTYSGPIFMALLAPVLIGERVPGISIGALSVSAAGVALISFSTGGGGDAVRPAGIVLALLAAISMALLIVLIKRWCADIDPRTVSVYQDTAATVVLSPAFFVPSYHLGGSELGYLLVVSVVLTGLVGVVYLTALRWVPATTAGILAYMEPLSAATLAALVLHEPLTLAVIIGGAAIVAAGVAVILRSPDHLGGSVEEPVPAGEAVRA